MTVATIATSVGPQGVQPSAKTAPSSGAAKTEAPAVDAFGGEPAVGLQRRDQADEHQSHDNGDQAPTICSGQPPAPLN